MGENNDKPYNPAEDPYFLRPEAAARDNSGLEKVAAFILFTIGAVLFYKFGWAGIIAILVVAVLLVIVWILVRRNLMRSSAEAGYINRHNMTTRECITPREKKLKEKFYRMDCGYCGKSANVQITNLRRQKCPHCRSRQKRRA